MRYLAFARTCLILAATACAGFSALAQAPTLAVDVSSDRYPISPNIYGIANYGLDPTFAKQINLPTTRWGGDGTTRYNWQVDGSNSGFDWYFIGGNGSATPTPGGGPDTMIATFPTAGALITVPIIPYVNKTALLNCSFPTSVYGAQQSTNPYVFPVAANGSSETCGNSISTNGSQLTDTDIYANHIDNSASLQMSWIQHMVAAHGTAAHGGVPFYQLDNEPFGWSNTHRDVEPTQPDYPTITQLGEKYAAVIKQVDPSAIVIGPSDFTLGGWVGDETTQNGLLAAQYYLQQMAAYEQQNGVRILDYLDEHYYPVFSDQASQLASTRTLWDPTYNGGTWVEQYVFDGPMQLLPRMQQWTSQYYPGTKISISEYSIDSGSGSIVDALAEMDMLGIFGRQQLALAEMWYTPTPTYPTAYAFRMYRDYDGNGGEYGDTWVNATSTNQANLSIYASQRSTDHVVTIMVLNKTTSAIQTNLALSGTSLPATAAVYTYSGSNLNAIVPGANATISNGSISHNFPAYSATLFTFTPDASQLASTATILTASASSITSGQSITFTAAVTGSASPTGTVTFKDGNSSIGTGTLSNGTATLSTIALAIGNHSITAVYGGDANNASSTSTAVSVTVTQAAPASTNTSLSASATNITAGQSVTFTAAVTGSSPTGTVTFKDGSATLGTGTLASGKATFSTSTLAVGNHSITAVYGGDANNASSTSTAVGVTVTQAAPASTTTSLSASASSITSGQSVTFIATVTGTSPTDTVTFKDGSTTLGTATLASGKATFSTTTLAVGNHSITAVYGGDANNASSTSTAVSVTVTQAAPASTNTSLSASATSITAGQSVNFTAVVTGTSPTGTVTFKDGSSALGGAPVASGQATFSTSALAAGIHSITAVYSGDSKNAASSSTPLTVTVAQQITTPPAPAATTTTLTGSATQLATGQSLALTASVTGGTTPTGTVSFYDGTSLLSGVSLAGSQATYTTTSLNAGVHTITAAYSGDTNHAASTSTPLTVTVSQPASVPPSPPAVASTTTTLAGPADHITAGQSLSLTSKVTASTEMPTGTVTFNSGSNVLGTATLSSGMATFTVNGLTAGSYSMTATYSGDANNSPSTSAPLTIIVQSPAAPPSAPDFTLSLAQNALTVAPGSTGQTNVSISPENGFAASVNLSCTGLPAGATCSFAPGSLSPSSSDTTAMTIVTTPSTSLFGILFLTPFLGTFLNQKKRRFRRILFLASGALLLATGCGVTVNQAANNGTPAGTYNVLVSATSTTGQTHTQQLTLTVKSN